MSHFRTLGLFALSIGMLVFLTAVSPITQTPLTTGNHCVGHLTGVDPSSTEVSQLTELGCYATFEEAVAATNGESVDSISAVPQTPRHCVAHLTGVNPKSNDMSVVTDLGCYDTFAEAIFVGTKGVVQLSADIGPADLTQEMLDTFYVGLEGNNLDVVIGTDYDNQHFQGDTTYNYMCDGNCTSTHGFQAPTMPSGWDNKPSSARSYSGCNDYIHWTNTNFGGTNITCDMGNTCQTMGVMDNQTSSEQWFN